ncbi:MAG: hypothetical protein K6E72_04440 [Saccharofermentans sp.]|nr:hypothetical protein [Saccharofermentans sp.]
MGKKMKAADTAKIRYGADREYFPIIKVVSIFLCILAALLFFANGNDSFESVYDLVATRGIFRDPSYVNVRYREIVTGAFWKYLNGAAAVIWLITGTVYFLDEALTSLSGKFRAIADSAASIAALISIPLYFYLGCTVSKSTLKLNETLVMTAAVFASEIVIGAIYISKIFRKKNTFKKAAKTAPTIVMAILCILSPALPVALGSKAIDIADEYYEKNPFYEVMEKPSGKTDEDMTGYSLSNARFYDGVLYQAANKKIYRIDKDGNISVFFEGGNMLITDFEIYDGKLFYVEGYSNLRCYDLAAGNTTEIHSMKGRYGLFYAQDGKLYFSDSLYQKGLDFDCGVLYCVDMDEDCPEAVPVFTDIRDNNVFRYYALNGYDPETVRSYPAAKTGNKGEVVSYDLIPYRGHFLLAEKHHDAERSAAYYSLFDGEEYDIYNRALIEHMDAFTVHDGKIYFTWHSRICCLVRSIDLESAYRYKFMDEFEGIDALEGRTTATHISVTDDLIVVTFNVGIRVIKR